MPAFLAVHALTCGEFVAPRRFFEVGERGFWRMPVLVFAIESAEGVYLVDTGVLPSPITWPIRVIGAGHAPDEWRIAARLAQIGRTLADVRGVLMTHLDYDHTGELRAFARIPVTMTRAERAFAMSPPLVWSIGRFNRGTIGSLESVKEVEPGPLPGIEPFDRGADVFGDGSLLLLDLAGHTPGHAGYLVRLEGGRRILLCGDAAFTFAHVRSGADGREPGLFPNLVAVDRERMRSTLGRLKSFAERQKDVLVVPSHEPSVGARARLAPYRL